jgi:putative membrane protein
LYDRPIDLARSLFFSWAANAIALVVVIAVFDKVTIGSLGDLILAALLFGILNTLLKPVIKAITLPLAIITLRLAWFGVSMLMLILTAAIIDSFDIHGFWALVWATVVVWVVNLVLDIAPGPWKGTRRD